MALLAGVSAVSSASVLIRLSSAGPLAIAAWRMLLSGAMMAAASFRSVGAILGLSGRERLILLISGVSLAAHFSAWVTSLFLTTVAASVVLVDSSPVFSALISWALLGERPSRRDWVGVCLALMGAAAMGWGESPGNLVGDLLALAGAIFLASYLVAGRRLRPVLPTGAYSAAVYSISGVLMTPLAAAAGQPMLGLPPRDYVIFLALAAGPSCLGHTSYNYALRYLPAHAVGVAILGEPIGASLLAWAVLGEVPPAGVLLGSPLIAAGVLTVTLDRFPPPGRRPS